MDGPVYIKDGKEYLRPTHVLDYFYPPELVDWKIDIGRKEANKISRAALKHGKKIDELIRANKEPSKKDSEEVKSCWKAWMKWVGDFQPGELIFPETQYDEERMVAGTPDIYWVRQRMIIDIKSSKELHEGNFFQTGGCYAHFTSLPFPVERVGIVRLDKEIENYEFMTNEQLGLSLPILKKGFDGLVDYYRVYHRLKMKLQPREKVYDGSNSEDADA